MKKTTAEFKREVMACLVIAMAEAGPDLVAKLQAAVDADAVQSGRLAGERYKPGHAIDVMMQQADAAEFAAKAADPEAFFSAIVAVLFLARDVAISQGVLKTEPVAKA